MNSTYYTDEYRRIFIIVIRLIIIVRICPCEPATF